jgi:hypothetical protein
MQTGLLHLHSFLRWLVVLAGIWSIIRAFGGMQKGSPFTATDKKAGLFFMIFCDVQLLIGLALYVLGPWGIKNIQNMGMGEVMKNSVARFFAMEHLVMMVIAIALVHIGKAQAKKNIPDAAKHKKTFIFFLVAMIIMFLSIPWPFREVGAGRGWF